MAKKVVKKSKKKATKKTVKKPVVKKTGKKKVSSNDFPVEKDIAGREVYLPTGGVRKMSHQDVLDETDRLHSYAPSFKEECCSYATQAIHDKLGITVSEAPKPSLFQRIKNFLGLGN